MRIIFMVVAALTIAVYVMLPIAKQYKPGWFPDNAEHDTEQATLRAHDAASTTSGCKDGVHGFDTATMPPRLPRITTPETIHALVTAYDPYDKECVGENAGILPRRTPTGDDVEQPGIAVDLEVIPAGSKIEIPGMGTFVADDTGCAMRLAARSPNITNFYQLDVRVPAPYSSFPDPAVARREAHMIAASLGARWIEVRITPPPNATD